MTRNWEREESITDRQARLSNAIRRVLGVREWANPSTPRGLRAAARWWDLEAQRDADAETRERCARCARTLRERAKEVVP